MALPIIAPIIAAIISHLKIILITLGVVITGWLWSEVVDDVENTKQEQHKTNDEIIDDLRRTLNEAHARGEITTTEKIRHLENALSILKDKPDKPSNWFDGIFGEIPTWVIIVIAIIILVLILKR